MKPKDLQFPPDWDDSKAQLHDRVWYIPQELDHLSLFPGWPALFPLQQSIKIEYCSGNGAWIAAKAKEVSHINWIAVERQFSRVRKIWSKIKNHQLSNLLAVYGEAHTVTQRYIPSESVNEIFINFPDPWPKRYHARHRIIQPEFLIEMARILQPGGRITFVTDDPAYSQWTIKMFAQHSAFVSLIEYPYFVTAWPDYGVSLFEELWRSKGLSIHYHQFEKV